MGTFPLLFTFLLWFTLPAEQNRPSITENMDFQLIGRILIDSKLFAVYSYNDAGLPSEERFMYQYFNYQYNSQNQLISADYYEDAQGITGSSLPDAATERKEWVKPGNTPLTRTMTYEYDPAGHLLRSTDNRDHWVYDYDVRGRISRETYYHQDKKYSYTDFSYEAKGNLRKKSTFEYLNPGNARLVATWEYEYDRKMNPFRVFRRLMVPGKYTNFNNITKETYTLHYMADHPVNEKEVKEFTYQYNEKGYPVKVNGNTEYQYK